MCSSGDSFWTSLQWGQLESQSKTELLRPGFLFPMWGHMALSTPMAAVGYEHISDHTQNYGEKHQVHFQLKDVEYLSQILAAPIT